MKYEDFADHAFYCVQRWVRAIIDGSETHVLEDIEDNQKGGMLQLDPMPVRILSMKLLERL